MPYIHNDKPIDNDKWLPKLNIKRLIIMMKIQISNFRSLQQLLLSTALITVTLSSAYNYSSCNSTSYLNAATLACISCQSNQISNSYQTVAISCQCAGGYLPANGACAAAFTSPCATNNSYYPIYNRDGSSNSPADCLPCAANASVNRYAWVHVAMAPAVRLADLG